MPTATSALSFPLTDTSSRPRSILIIGALFFTFGFVTWMNSILIPYLKIASELSSFQAYSVAFTFYIAYIVMVGPSVKILNATGLKTGIALGLVVMAAGALLFVPAAITRMYTLFILGLFIQGCGLAVLQTSANLYITLLGPVATAAKRFSIMGLCNKTAGALAPIVLGTITLRDSGYLKNVLLDASVRHRKIVLDQLAAHVIFPYLIMAALLTGLALLIARSALPEIKTADEPGTGSNQSPTKIFRFPHLIMGVLAMFCYAGVEVMTGDTIISYAALQGIPWSTAKFFTTYTLAGMIIGYLSAIICIPSYFSQQKALLYSALLGFSLTLLALFTKGYSSVFFIACLGLANALIWPAIWSLALAGLGRFTKLGSSLLITGISGGAILPLFYRRLTDISNTQQAYWIMASCYAFIWYYAVQGHQKKRKPAKFNI